MAALTLTLAGLSLAPVALLAFPPAPDHLIYGMVRDEYGNPLNVSDARILLESDAGVAIEALITPNLALGINYRMNVPMDSGLTAEPYKPTALRPDVPFRMSVTIGRITYLPIEMTGDFQSLGLAGRETRIDLTLGEDLDGDGLPDAWERALLKAGQTLSDINPDDDTDGDGMSNLNEYIAGTYAFDSEDGLDLKIAGFRNGAPVLKFLGLQGRIYTVNGSADLKAWKDVVFTLPPNDSNADAQSHFRSSDVREIEIEVPMTGNQSDCRFFKLRVK